MVLLFYILSSVQEFQFLHTHTNTWYSQSFNFSHSKYVENLIVVLIFIFLMTNGVKHLFMCLIAIIYLLPILKIRLFSYHWGFFFHHRHSILFIIVLTLKNDRGNDIAFCVYAFLSSYKCCSWDFLLTLPPQIFVLLFY